MKTNDGHHRHDRGPNTGKPKDCRKRAVARAVNRQLDPELKSRVGRHVVLIEKDEPSIFNSPLWSAHLSAVARELVARIDMKGCDPEPTPVTFDADIPAEYLRSST